MAIGDQFYGFIETGSTRTYVSGHSLSCTFLDLEFSDSPTKEQKEGNKAIRSLQRQMKVRTPVLNIKR